MTSVVAIDRLFEAHLIVADLDASIAFYRDRLGLELAHVTPARQAAFLWIGSRGRAMLGLWQAGTGPQKTTTHIAFTAAADDVIAAPGRLQSAGIVALDFTGQPTDEPVVLAWMPAVAVYFLDPDGHLLEYIAMLEDEPRPDDGVVTWRAWTLTTMSGRVIEEASVTIPLESSKGDTNSVAQDVRVSGLLKASLAALAQAARVGAAR